MIRNLTRKKILAKEHRRYGSLWLKGLGLMFRLRAPDWAPVFPFDPPARASIHMCFVFFSLDIVWLDADMRVIEWRTLRPWRMHRPRQRAAYVLELPAGVCAKTGMKNKDLIEIKKN